MQPRLRLLRAVIAATLLGGGMTASAQPDAPAPTTPVTTISGKVRDATTGDPLPGAVITASNGASAISDGDGVFTLAAPPGTSIQISADGYQARTDAIAGDGPLELTLDPVATVGGETVEIVDTPPAQAAGGAHLSREELATMPGTGGDLLASLDVLPGVTSGVGTRRGGQGVIIRGSGPEDSRILLDGFDIPQLYHILNRSIIPTDAVAGLEYLPGGFDVRYGRATSGIISVTSRGGGDQVDGSAEVSVIDANAVASGPVGKHGHVLASFRRSYLDSWLPSVMPKEVGLVTAPRYYDGLLRLDWDLTERWRGAVTVVGSDDLTELIAQDDQSDDDFHFTADTKFVRAIAASYWRGPRGWSLEAGTSVLAQGVSFSFNDQFVDVAQQSYGARAELRRQQDELAGLKNVVWRVGTELDVRHVDLDLAFEDRGVEGEANQDMGPPGDDPDAPQLSFDGTFWLADFGGWTALEADLTPKLRLTSGLRLDAYVRNRDVQVQPRGELTYAIDDETKLRFVAGRYTRAPENQRELLSPDAGAESATQVMVGASRDLGLRGNVQLTVYDSERTDLLTRDAMTNTFVNQGRGRTYGAEVLASYHTDQVFGWLSYSLSRSTRQDSPTAEERLFDFDQTHDLVLAASWKSRNRRWQIGGRFTYTTGKPYTPVVGAVYDSDHDRYLPLSGPINSERFPAHHQLDVRIDHTWRFKTWEMSAFLDVANVYLNAEIAQYQYSFDYDQKAELTGLPIVPSIGLRGEL